MRKSNFRNPRAEYQLSTDTRDPGTPAFARRTAIHLVGKWT